MNNEKHIHITSSPVRTGLPAHPTPAARVERSKMMPGIRHPRQSGQAAIIIALSMVALIAIVGLAIDGGAAYQQRRIAQNSADAAALAATRVMLDAYMDRLGECLNNEGDPEYPDCVGIEGSPETDEALRGTLD